jgi:hypothetical protein
MLVTLAVIGALALFVCFIRALGLKRINLEFDRDPPVGACSRESGENEKRPKQLNK